MCPGVVIGGGRNGKRVGVGNNESSYLTEPLDQSTMINIWQWMAVGIKDGKRGREVRSPPRQAPESGVIGAHDCR